ncbi:Phosphoethanolamine N-methyltransferase-related protein [Tritrichomonas foetus]|uniref:Phosphoethanolamine N-methyltransferase-related protein n=1 Tax=Tritrichomonas foetus TaxID=1144522 RepID=A0A1J4KG10_9EUKA|nr:Phosphoethanolamine N-methyltransferase-related protein [Tritrichomonas foetus]|eukprot:OHT10353.1 Phosphoethanolamine N-methyltransferase-related protein [Tritrichomonas foetus]
MKNIMKDKNFSVPETQEDINSDSDIIQGINFSFLKKEFNCNDKELIERLMKTEKSMQENENGLDSNDESSQDIQDYGASSYWEERYIICPTPFDWYVTWDQIEYIIGSLFNGEELALNIGCGNSCMSEDMQKKLFKVVVSIDISPSVIYQMKEMHKNNHDLIWYTMDCSKMSFEDEMFDAVFDKGTFDALLCGPNAITIVYETMKEIYRELKGGGVFIEITYGEPKNRLTFFKNLDIEWKLYDPEVIINENDGQRTYIYIFQKLSHTVMNKLEI